MADANSGAPVRGYVDDERRLLRLEQDVPCEISVDQLIAPEDGTQRGHQFLHQASARPGRRERQLAPRDAVRDRPPVCARREKRRECLVPDGRVKHVPNAENVEPSPRLMRTPLVAARRPSLDAPGARARRQWWGDAEVVAPVQPSQEPAEPAHEVLTLGRLQHRLTHSPAATLSARKGHGSTEQAKRSDDSVWRRLGPRV